MKGRLSGQWMRMRNSIYYSFKARSVTISLGLLLLLGCSKEGSTLKQAETKTIPQTSILPKGIEPIRLAQYRLIKRDEKREFELSLSINKSNIEGEIREGKLLIPSVSITQYSFDKPLVFKVSKDKSIYDLNRLNEIEPEVKKLLDLLLRESLNDYVNRNKRGMDMILSPNGPINCTYTDASLLGKGYKIYFYNKAPILGIVTIKGRDFVLEWVGPKEEASNDLS